MRKLLIVLICIFLRLFSQSQSSIFTVLHLNEERNVRQGVPQQIIETTKFYSSKETEFRKEIINFDRAGLPVFRAQINEEGDTTLIVTNKYDTLKRVLLESYTNELKVRFPKNRVHTIYTYEKGKSPTKIQFLNKGGSVLSEVLITNDDMLCLPVKFELYEPVGYLFASEIASYIPDKNKAIVSVLDNRGRILSTDTMSISFKDAYKFPDSSVLYNEKGDVIFYKDIWPNGSIQYSEYEYTYDFNGNWVKYEASDVKYKSNGKKKRKLKSIHERTVDYWKE